MKAIIYTGIGLFAAASVLGVADYYRSGKNGTLDKLYKEEEPVKAAPEKTEAVKPIPEITANMVSDKTAPVATKGKTKAKTVKRTIKFDDFSRGRIMEPEITPLETETPVKTETTPAKKEEQEPVKALPAVEEKSNVTTERKLSLEMFSRAPLRKQVKPVKKANE